MQGFEDRGRGGAGLKVGYWSDLEDIQQNRKVERIFRPAADERERTARYAEWQRAVERSRSWAK